ncbi:MAG TPA: PH domain-containing protein [Alphaproteobacteria bacterium]|jgi:uncharacterized membrane protein YdbT with pleckstrin-like domain|nr:PH domain-containing protein [Alphaproteobacteria bacterium]
MSYVEKTLQAGETIVYQTRLHWIVFLPAIVVAAGGLIAILFSGRAGDATLVNLVKTLGLALILFAAVMAISMWIQFASTEMAITNRRVVAKIGFIWRRTIEMERQKVESVSVDQSILGRVLDYGTIIVRGTGSTLEPMANIDDPLEFRNKLLAGSH